MIPIIQTFTPTPAVAAVLSGSKLSRTVSAEMVAKFGAAEHVEESLARRLL